MAKLPNYYKIHTDGHDVALEPIYSELVSVVRCKDCANACEGNECLVCVVWGARCEDNGFCYKGERKGDVTDG